MTSPVYGASLWEKLNHLVPEPQCRTFGDDYSKIVWTDQRPKPTEAALNAVTDQVIENRTKDNRADRELNSDLVDSILEAVAAGGTLPQMKAKFRSTYRGKL